MAEFTAEERARTIVTLALHHDDAQLAASMLNSDPDPLTLAATLVGVLVAAVTDAAACREMDRTDYWAALCERNAT